VLLASASLTTGSRQLWSPAGSSTTKKENKGRGKTSKIPIETEELLEYEGVPQTMLPFDKVTAALFDKPYSTPLTSPQDVADLGKVAKQQLEDVDKVAKGLQNIDVKLMKRTSTPPDALEALRKLKNTVKNVASLLREVTKRTFDAERTKKIVEECNSDGIKLGVGFHARIYHQEAPMPLPYNTVYTFDVTTTFCLDLVSAKPI
jgi:hypothetical protein